MRQVRDLLRQLANFDPGDALVLSSIIRGGSQKRKRGLGAGGDHDSLAVDRRLGAGGGAGENLMGVEEARLARHHHDSSPEAPAPDVARDAGGGGRAAVMGKREDPA